MIQVKLFTTAYRAPHGTRCSSALAQQGIGLRATASGKDRSDMGSNSRQSQSPAIAGLGKTSAHRKKNVA
ncbi:MAG: hypothetical protein ORN29_02230 [Rhodoferax sp.]|nr:hypothetical protein [Rhodoferax sp.]